MESREGEDGAAKSREELPSLGLPNQLALEHHRAELQGGKSLPVDGAPSHRSLSLEKNQPGALYPVSSTLAAQVPPKPVV